MENPFEIIIEKLNRIEEAIAKLNTTSKNDNNIIIGDNIMIIDQVAQILDLSKPTIYGLIHQKKIPHYKVGKRLYFKKSDIENWIFSNKIKSHRELEKEAMEYIRKNPL